MINPSRSLEQLEGDSWGAPPADATRLISTAYALRRKPVGDLSAEDLRLLLGQHIGVETLVPLALTMLEDDPLAEGDFYPGDLLVAVLKAPATHWPAHPGDLDRVRRVVEALHGPQGPALQPQLDAFHAAHLG
ncbi:contact-dependent growth inhibition system immunity protein [Amycolatopsis tolypomycina]|uniref:contact-dependent growth inhibition system immunity protein n=1 Tax=Amycolatopsis tolypomycina TaxID=208445 RepID=UPI0033B5813C